MAEKQAMMAALGAIRAAPDVVPLRAAVMKALALHGIEACFFLAPLVDNPRVGRIVTNMGVSRIWERQYRTRLRLIDPLPRLAMARVSAFVWLWDIELAALDPAERRYLQIAARHGMARGIGSVCYGPNGRAGFLGAIWPRKENPSDEVVLSVQQIGQVSFQRYCRIVREEFAVEPLSNRELEVLDWMCRGKSNPVIALILGVSRSTVDTYVRRIFAKFDVTDRVAACMRAHSLGLTVTDEVERRIARGEARDRD
ncbi:helix-turn-helix transcriptional regulator [Aurantiacibacter luteus]|uniref:helix-turn-helix transcriptional regulator n=1 Tax=Aurantiacibacter luteus TaxID=1581420 RepID=UPI000A72EBAF|nr:helix-turn-helix transcriptional regulator [Aurantiacibacter luteus]